MATEKRLIERIADRLKDAYPQADRNNLCPAIYYDDFAEIVDDVLSEFEEAVDAVEVVRCKDCKQLMLWCKPTDKVIGECFIRKMNSEDEQFCMVGADDFCSYGERKDNG